MAAWSVLEMARVAAFFALESLLLPWHILALFWLAWNLRTQVIAKHASVTAHGTFLIRLLMHAAGTRPDPAAARLAPHLPAMNHFISAAVQSFGLTARVAGVSDWLFRYLWTARKGEPSMLQFVQQRTFFMDRAVEKAVGIEWGLEGQVGQVVILGAGYDTRAWGVLKDEPVLVFEVDKPETHKAKRAAIRRGRLDSTKALLVPCDFNEKTWLQALLDHGFDRKVPTLIVCEGVLMFLQEEAVRKTFGAFNNLARQSFVAFDLVNMDLLEGLPPFSKFYSILHQFVGEILREPLLWGVSAFPFLQENVSILLNDLGLKVQDATILGDAIHVMGGFFLASN